MEQEVLKFTGELWVIEAPGKAQHLQALLARVGVNARVQATKGHFMVMPSKLNPVGIDQSFQEFLREPQNQELITRLRAMSRDASKVVIATDADSEGDVIAWDVAETIKDIQPHPLRVRLKSMDDESIKEAISLAKPVAKDDAIPGRTRAIVDRLIGSVFSHDGVAVGRVGTAMLGVIAIKRPTIFRLNLCAPATDNGRPWLTQTDIKFPLNQTIAQRLINLEFPALDIKASNPFVSPPQHMGDIMIRASEEMEITPAETARAMQRTYEAGRLSYPRAGSRGMSKSAARKMKKVLAQAGYKYDDNVVSDKPESEPHDAPYPIGTVDVSKDPKRLGADEGVRTLIARDLIKSGQTQTRQTPGTEKIVKFLLNENFTQEVAEYIGKLPWRRDQGPRYPGQVSWGSSEIIERRPDAVMLEAMLDTGLGRPSTWANHVENFLKRDLVDQQLSLTSKGKAWIQASPKELVDPRISVAIERACERITPQLYADDKREPWEVLAEKIINALPVVLKEPLLNTVNAEKPHVRRDFRALSEPGIDFDQIPQTPSMGYAPPQIDEY